MTYYWLFHYLLLGGGMVTTLSWIISISCIEYLFECVPTNRQFPRKLEVLPRKSNNENIKFLIVYFIPTVVENGISLYNQQMPVWGYLCWHCYSQRRIIIKITSVIQLLGGSLKVLLEIGKKYYFCGEIQRSHC